MQYVIPLAITGPAAIPFMKTTPIIVPKTRATVISGWPESKFTPFAESRETPIPLNMATQPIGDLKAFIRSRNPISLVAIGIKIAIVDQGIELTHPDLSENCYILSYDTETSSSPSRVYGEHGTHCAGIAAAVRNNGIFTVGVAPDAKLISVSNSLSGASVSNLANGINWAWNNGADIISCSWWCNQSEMIEDAIDNALFLGRNHKGCIFVKSAGNRHAATSPEGSSISYPGDYRPEVLTVGAIKKTGVRANFSSTGPALDVVAPGVDIYSTVPNGGMAYKDGTSMATPHVAGLAALILERNPRLTGQQVRDIIEKTSKKVGSTSYNINKPNGTWNSYYGYGLVDAHQALLATPLR